MRRFYVVAGTCWVLLGSFMAVGAAERSVPARYDGRTAAEWLKVLAERLKKLPKHRATLVTALGQTKHPSALPPLMWALHNGPYTSEIGRTIRGFGDAALPLLLPLLRHKEWRIRERGAWAISDVGPPAKAAVGALRTALKDRNRQVRDAAAVALGNIGPAAAAAVPDLIGIIDEGNAAVGALGRIGPSANAAVPALVRVLRDKRREHADRDLAAQGLGRIGTPAVGAIGDLQAVIEEHPNPNNGIRVSAQDAIRLIRKACGETDRP